LAGSNPSFDRDFIKNALQRNEIEFNLGYHTVDIHTMGYCKHLKSNKTIPVDDAISSLKTSDILEFVGLPREPEPHNALTGAKMVAEAFSRFIYKKNLLDEYKEYEIPDYL
jgi:DNA polymerase III epsilon subunit-like protein